MTTRTNKGRRSSPKAIGQDTYLDIAANCGWQEARLDMLIQLATEAKANNNRIKEHCKAGYNALEDLA